MSPNLERISFKARANPDLVFTSLYHYIADIDHLRTCFHLLKGNKGFCREWHQVKHNFL